MKEEDVIDWHTNVAVAFDAGYKHKADFKERLQVWSTLIERYSNPAFHVLDIGCGSGIFSKFAADKNATVTGVDASPEMIRLCNDKKLDSGIENVNFLQGNILSLDEMSLSKANLIICSSLLEYLEDIERGLDMLVSLLLEDGVLIISLPNRRSLFRKLEPVIYRITGRPKYYKYVKSVCTLEDISERLLARGLDITNKVYFSATPLLSKIFRKVGLARYSDNLFVVAARRCR